MTNAKPLLTVRSIPFAIPIPFVPYCLPSPYRSFHTICHPHTVRSIPADR
ncbi:hypothetical protein [Pseudanabaena sp. PCC 6802]|nr:hypothetical protein [Pseudanabaena sp. PCC 6802]